MGLTVTAIALAVVILASNFTIINAQQSRDTANNLEKLRVEQQQEQQYQQEHFKAQMTASAYRYHKAG